MFFLSLSIIVIVIIKDIIGYPTFQLLASRSLFVHFKRKKNYDIYEYNFAKIAVLADKQENYNKHAETNHGMYLNIHIKWVINRKDRIKW